MQLGLDCIRSRGQRAEGLGSGCLLLEHYLSLIILHVPLKFTIIDYLTLIIPFNINSDEKCIVQMERHCILGLQCAYSNKNGMKMGLEANVPRRTLWPPSKVHIFGNIRFQEKL